MQAAILASISGWGSSETTALTSALTQEAALASKDGPDELPGGPTFLDGVDRGVPWAHSAQFIGEMPRVHVGVVPSSRQLVQSAQSNSCPLIESLIIFMTPVPLQEEKAKALGRSCRSSL